MSKAKLQVIEKQLKDIERSANQLEFSEDTNTLVAALNPVLREWEKRFSFFDHLASELDAVSRIDQNPEVDLRAAALQHRALEVEYLLNLILAEADVPAQETDTAIRFVVEHDELLKSTAVQRSLLNLALRGPSEFRRLAWFNICRKLPYPLLLRPGASSKPKWGAGELKSLRDELIANRTSLGSRGTLLNTGESRGKQSNQIPDLLAALVLSEGKERLEAVLALGEVGGVEVAVFLADSLSAELSKKGDENYQVSLVSALANLGGSASVEALLEAIEAGTERVQLTALSGLEFLTTSAAIALTESPEPAVLASVEMRDAYIQLIGQLTRIMSTGEASLSAYVRYRTEELVDTLNDSVSLFARR